jgi:acyl-CoA synthetase (AMP-forming)/AMP-acid ligase II
MAPKKASSQIARRQGDHEVMLMEKVVESDEEFKQRVEAEPLPKNLGALLDDAINRYGSSPAWVFVEQDRPPLSWQDLGDLVARSAHSFAAMGVRKGSHVGVMLPNIPESLAAWLAIARLGARMIPINPGYTPDELKYWLTDGDAEFLLIDSSKIETLYAVDKDAPLLTRDRVAIWGEALGDFQHWNGQLAEAPANFRAAEDVELDDIVNIQYTSGSTGWPKGCLLSHRYWILCGKVVSEAWPGLKRIQCDLPFYYMGPLWRFTMAAFSGAALCVPPAYSLSRFRERIRDYAYDMAWMTNPVAMLEPDPTEQEHQLKMIATFGMGPALQSSIAKRYKVPVRDAFGMTEIGFAIGCRLNDERSVGMGTCGKVLPFREAKIADPDGNELPDGEIGELCIAGPGMLQGYYKKPEATKAAFHGKWFRTGDLARRDSDGYFYIVGRIKDMIRRSAENISVTEVESALAIIPEVEDIAVHGVKDEKRGEEVKACLILRSGLTTNDLPPEKVLEHARNHLARFKVPRYIQYYSKFPRTGSNKIAKKRLQDGEGEFITGTYDSATGAWSEVAVR